MPRPPSHPAGSRPLRRPANLRPRSSPPPCSAPPPFTDTSACPHATEEAYSLAAELLASRAGRRRYLLRVVGQSMVGARIEDGDLLVVEEDESPPDGSVVVALLREDEEVTVKRLYREGEMLRLRPHAPPGEYEELVVPANEARVQGRVVYVLHPPGRKGGA